jgi:hypothetical protein
MMLAFALRKAALFLALSLAAAPAVAQGFPWERERPSGMTQTHQELAQGVQAYLDRNGMPHFQRDPKDTNWGWQRGRQRQKPVSNMDQAQLNALFVGRYFVYQEDGEGDAWSVRYHDPDGRTHYCLSTNRELGDEFVLTRYVKPVKFGLSGYFHKNMGQALTKDDEFGWPYVANAQNGQVATWIMQSGRLSRSIGWVQEDYADAFSVRCPNLPRVGRVNTQQVGNTIQEIARGARPLRGFRVSFPNDPANPLTAEMLFWAHPPR